MVYLILCFVLSGLALFVSFLFVRVIGKVPPSATQLSVDIC